MAPIDDALAAIESLGPGEKLCYSTIAKKYDVVRSTLTRRHKAQARSRTTRDEDQRKLNPQQEHELVLYIEQLTKRGLPPTRVMVQNYASKLAKTRVSESWVSRFINRNDSHLISKWSAGMDADRHKADSSLKYKLYYDLLYSKISQYKIIPINTYNIDEKSFIIGVIGRQKQVFSKRQYTKKEVTSSLQDSNKE